MSSAVSKFIKQRSLKSGLEPGTLLYVGNNISEETTIEVLEYNENDFSEKILTDNQLNDFINSPFIKGDTLRWINIDGLMNMKAIEKLCLTYGIHPLVIEDIFNTSQRAKIENYDSYLYIVAKMIYFSENELINEQMSIIIGDGYVITFGEKRGDDFDGIRTRLKSKGTHIRKCGADFLAYSILDAVVDGYFGVLEMLGEKIDEGEDELLNNPTIENLHSMKEIRKELLYMHKAIWPLREVASWMERDGAQLIDTSTQLFIRDLYDHIMGAIDTIETFRELQAGMMDLYLSSISNKMNNIMKVLTIISTIFIPLTFIVGLYGMNFKYMPELDFRFGYLGVVIVMVVIAIFMILYFKRKKWF